MDVPKCKNCGKLIENCAPCMLHPGRTGWRHTESLSHFCGKPWKSEFAESVNGEKAEKTEEFCRHIEIKEGFCIACGRRAAIKLPIEPIQPTNHERKLLATARERERIVKDKIKRTGRIEVNIKRE